MKGVVHMKDLGVISDPQKGFKLCDDWNKLRDVIFKVGRKVTAKPTVFSPERHQYVIDEDRVLQTETGPDAIRVAHWNPQDKRVAVCREKASLTSKLLKGTKLSFDNKNYTPCDTEVMLHSQVVMDEAVRGAIAGISSPLGELVLNTYVMLRVYNSYTDNKTVLEMTKVFKPPVERQYVADNRNGDPLRKYTSEYILPQEEKKYFVKVDLDTGNVLEETGEAEGRIVSD